jgi:hypothetical protein
VSRLVGIIPSLRSVTAVHLFIHVPRIPFQNEAEHSKATHMLAHCNNVAVVQKQILTQENPTLLTEIITASSVF